MAIPACFWVINTSKQTHTDKYGGRIMEFKPGEPVLVEWDIANTCFGLDEPNPMNALQRLGWVQPGSKPEQIQKARARLEQFHIEQAEFAPPKGPQ